MKIQCPNCNLPIDEDERIRILGTDFGLKKTGFSENDFPVFFCKADVCPGCGIFFIPNMNEIMKEVNSSGNEEVKHDA